jgi:Pyruvate/2-oxoglutarate dehydrogenase complex, dehydrogenase (E1) component, eukaryotic type, beta subunit
MASAWKLPVIFINENNGYGISCPQSKSMAITDIADRAAGYDMPGVVIDGNDVLAVYEAVTMAVERARKGQGPSLIECKTYRWRGHFEGDACVYRSEKELEEWKAKDPIPRFAKKLVETGTATQAELDAITVSVAAEIEAAVKFAEDSPFPKPEDLLEDVYALKRLPETAETTFRFSEWRKNMAIKTYLQALNDAMRQEMERDENVFIIGEDVGKFGGCFGVTQGLFDQFGERRVRDTPITESAIVGAAAGAAAAGLRPVAELMFVDFIGVALDQLFNQAAKMHYMFGGKAKGPMGLRMPHGAGVGAAAHHSQSLEAWFMHIPGIKVCIPSTPANAKGLLISAIRDDNPVVFLQHKILYGVEGEVGDEATPIELGKGDVKREGTDVTIVATSLMVHSALQAAETLAAQGISAEVVDPRCLVPLNKDIILNSVKKTHALVVAHEAVKTAGAGAEIAAMVAEEALDYLDAPIVRVGAPYCPVPFSPPLEKAYIPGADQIVAAVKSLR